MVTGNEACVIYFAFCGVEERRAAAKRVYCAASMQTKCLLSLVSFVGHTFTRASTDFA